MQPIAFGRFHYAGIGTRRLTKSSSIIMIEYACCMAFYGAVVDSGAADGSDTSFEVGAKIAYDAMVKLFPDLTPGQYSNVIAVHLPWSGFNGRWESETSGYYHDTPSEAARKMAEKHHPSWNTLKDAAKKMMCRTSLQVMGRNMGRPARFVVCETPDGAHSASATSSKSGGTGQAIRVADAQGVPIYNLKHKAHYEKITAWIDEADLKIQKSHGVSPKSLVEEYLSSFVGIKKRTTGNLVQMAHKGEVDVLVHGCNLMYMNSGIAKEIRETFPEAYQSFLRTKKGDKKKLGTIDCVTVERNGKPITIVNAFVQPIWGRDPNILYVDYESVRKCFEAVAKTFDHQKIIGIPRIGTGLGNGCWVTLSNTIQLQMKNHNLLLVDYDGESLKSEFQEESRIEHEQIGFGF